MLSFIFETTNAFNVWNTKRNKKHSENARFHAYALRTIVIDEQNRGVLKIDRRKTKAHSVKIYALAARRVWSPHAFCSHNTSTPSFPRQSVQSRRKDFDLQAQKKLIQN